MSNNNDISVQMNVPKTYTLRHPDGSEVTAQEVYDAFMSGLVILSASSGNFLALGINWVDANAGTDDQTNVVAVSVINSKSLSIKVGTYPS